MVDIDPKKWLETKKQKRQRQEEDEPLAIKLPAFARVMFSLDGPDTIRRDAEVYAELAENLLKLTEQPSPDPEATLLQCYMLVRAANLKRQNLAIRSLPRARRKTSGI